MIAHVQTRRVGTARKKSRIEREKKRGLIQQCCKKMTKETLSQQNAPPNLSNFFHPSLHPHRDLDDCQITCIDKYVQRDPCYPLSFQINVNALLPPLLPFLSHISLRIRTLHPPIHIASIPLSFFQPNKK